MKKKIAFTMLLTVAVSSIDANTLRLKAGAWMGEYQTELEDRMFLDDLTEPGNSRLNQEWEGIRDVSFPIGVEYHHALPQGELVFALNYRLESHEPSFDGFALPIGISEVRINGYNESNLDFEAGYRIPLIEGEFFLTPLVGVRSHSRGFEYEETTYGFTGLAMPSITIATEGDFTSRSSVPYAGLGFEFALDDKLAFLFDYRTSLFFPSFAGDMSFKRTRIGTAPFIFLEDATADMEISLNQWMLGARYSLQSNLHLTAGFKSETITVSYPGYSDLPLFFLGSNIPGLPGATGIAAGISVNEIITDSIFWNQEQKTTRGMVFVGISYDFNL